VLSQENLDSAYDIVVLDSTDVKPKTKQFKNEGLSRPTAVTSNANYLTNFD
jgi:hypothetical protein